MSGLRSGSLVQIEGMEIGAVEGRDLVTIAYPCHPDTEDRGRFGAGRTDDCDPTLFCAPEGKCAELEAYSFNKELHSPCEDTSQCGDGEVCVTAIETALTGTFEFHVHKGLPFSYPRAETTTHYITMAVDTDLDQCAIMALRDMIRLIGEKAGLSREDAYMLCSLAADLRITQTVNGNKGVHCMLLKNLIKP